MDGLRSSLGGHVRIRASAAAAFVAFDLPAFGPATAGAKSTSYGHRRHHHHHHHHHHQQQQVPIPGPLAVGIVGYPITNQDAQMMATGGIRLACFKMNLVIVQPTETGAFDWRNYDAAVGALARSGITAMPFLMRTTLESVARPAEPG